MLSLLPMRVARRRLLGLAFVGLFLVNISLFAISVKPVSAPPGILTFKWRVNPGNTKTLIAPLAADLIVNRTGLEIVVTGGATIGDTTKANSNGNVTVIDGVTGQVVWTVRPAPIGIHTVHEIHDLDKDGFPEIIIVAYDQVIALRGNDGSVYWRATSVGNVDTTYPAIADIDGDGYVEIFVAGNKGPQQGWDYVTAISYDGRILGQAPISWYPCYGGFTIGDTDGDGKFELYQGDRSRDYSRSWDKYKGGGHGVNRIDVNRIDPYTITFTRVWEAPYILSSSHAPVLADVDKDRILDVIAVNQPGGPTHPGNGLVVLRASDGTVLTTPNGKYRNQTGIGTTGHSPPTVYDIDRDGNLELITSYPNGLPDGGTPTTVWDLYDWKMDKVLKDENGNTLFTKEPPKVGDLNGDGNMEIIAVTSQSTTYGNQNSSIYIYEVSGSTYTLLQKVTEANPGVKLSGPSPFTLLQDVDNDGLNELVLSSSSGNVYSYDTQVTASSPRVRSGVQFYSEYKRGAAEYVPPPGSSQSRYTIGLQSRQDTDASTNLGTITLDGAISNLPNNVSKIAGIYSVQYSANPSYAFDHWEKSGQISLSNPNANPTTVTVSGDGTLEAIYFDGEYLFESGFETGYFSSEWDGTIKSPGETATVVGTLHYEGSYSAKFTSNVGGGSENALVYKNLSPAMSEVYARAYVYVDTNGVQDDGDANWFISFRGSSGLAWAGWKKINNVLYWALTIRNGASYATSFTGAPVTGKWYSVELRWAKSALSGYGELWVDGLLQASIYNKDTDDYGDTSKVRFGMELFNSALTITYIDYAIIYEESSGPSSYTVNLVSEEDTVASSNLGSITFNGTLYTLPNSISTPAGSYSAQYYAAGGYTFDHWERTGSVSVSDIYAPSTTVTVSGNGTLKAIYMKTRYTVGLESEQNNGATINLGSIKFDGVLYTLPNSVSKIAGTYSVRYFSTAGHKFVRWEVTGSISVADTSAVSTTVTVSGNGTIKAVYNESPHIFESGFETGDFSEWDGTSALGGETAAVVGTLPYEGLFSARFTSNGGGGTETAIVYKNLPPAMSELYARAYVYVGATGIADNGDRHWFISFRNSSLSPSTGLAWAGWYKSGGVLRWALTIRNGAGYVSNFTGIPVNGTWYSVELHWFKDGANGYGKLWVDGSLQASIYNKDTDNYGDANVVRFGLELTGCAPTTAYIDSAVIDDEYIGRLNRAPTIDSYTPLDETPEVNEGESLDFTHTSSDLDGDLLTYSWLLDGTEMSTSQNWTYTPDYDDAGIWNVTLVDSDGHEGFDSQQWDVTVNEVGRPPTIYSYIPTDTDPQVDEGASLQFNHTSSDPDNDPLAYLWLLDGFEQATSQNWTYTPDYDDAGTHNVTLKVSDPSGLYDLQQWNVTVNNVNRAPVIDSYYPPIDPTIREGETQEFNVTYSDLDGDLVTVEWYLDGVLNGTSDSYTFIADYASSEVYNVTVVVSDGLAQASHEWILTVSEVNRSPTIDSYYPLSDPIINEGESQEFNITYSDLDGDFVTVQWYQNGTPTVTTDSYTFVADYNSVGIYNITVVVSDGRGGLDSHEWMFKVDNVNRPPAIDSYTPLDETPEVNEGESLDFTHTSSDLDGDSLSYSWILNNTEMSTAQNWTYLPGYSDAGVWNVTLVVSDGHGGFDSQQWNVTVNNVNRAPVISSHYPLTNATISEGESQAFNATYYDPDVGDTPTALWYLDSVLNTTGDSFIFFANFSSAGVYNITVVVSDGLAQTTHEWTLTVNNVNIPPAASFTESAHEVYTSEAINFNASASYDSDGYIASYFWDFGDGINSTEVTVDHAYANNGTYTVTLTVTDNDGATDTATATKTISNRPPVASFTESNTTVYTEEVIYFNASNSYDPDGIIVNYFWDFGDGNNTTGVTAEHAYIENGTYVVTLAVTDDDGATAFINATKFVLNRNPVANFTDSPQDAYTGDTITFNATTSYDPDGTIVSYAWDFGDGNITTVSAPIVIHSYADNGTYTVTLTVTDNDGASDAASANKIILNRPPSAIFTYSPSTPSLGQPMTFNASDSMTSMAQLLVTSGISVTARMPLTL